MTGFAFDLWQDLRAKRMWPAALVLLVALLAVPIFLIKSPAEEAGPAPVATQPAFAEVPALVDPASAQLGGSSRLDRFEERDPFAPTGGGGKGSGAGEGDPLGGGGTDSSLTGDGSGSSGDLTAGGLSTGGTDGSSSSASGLSSTATDTGASSSSPGGGATATGSTDGADGGSTNGDDSGSTGAGDPSGDAGGGATPTPETPAESETRFFAYEADVTYGQAGEARDYDRLEPFDLLTERDPLLLFSGVTADGKTAVFVGLEPLTEGDGDGRCMKIEGRCAVLYLKRGEQQTFVDSNGDSYLLLLRDTRRVTLDSKGASAGGSG